jgi:membrane protein
MPCAGRLVGGTAAVTGCDPVATVVWLGATSGVAWYARHIGHYNVMYGSVGAGIALLVWMYLLAIIALIGCEFNAEYERASMRS